MRTVRAIDAVRDAVRRARDDGARIALVPTMGFLHDGHLALVEAARLHADFVVMSVFVNPLQFGPTEDLARYPRDEAGDAAKAAERGVDLLFLPTVDAMYPTGTAVRVVPEGLDLRWEGAVRPGHFAGVLTVVTKLFNIVQPDVALFGQKDAQQVALVRALVRDLDMPLDLIIVPTVREADGVAMSSRNSYLTPDERVRARALSRALAEVRRMHADGQRSGATLERAGRAILEREDDVSVDYFAVVDPVRLEPVAHAGDGCIVIVAARVGRTRLLDNTVLGA